MPLIEKPLRLLGARTTGLGGDVFLTLGSETYVLSEVEVDIWRLCDGTRTTHDIASAISRDYTVDEETALADITAFVHELADAGLLEQE
ncbi:PqqD family protein [Streptomyces sp. NPDC001351]|uniref:PqqD family protein n=1 Tax=Streptomyces sp. NPDC001351 TaxID=3364564 RepID=UPI00367BAE6F